MTPETMADLHTAAGGGSRPWSSKEFTDLVNDRFAVVATGAHGFALGRLIAGEAELLLIVTDPKHQQQGHGRSCLAAFEQAVRQQQGTVIHLEVSANNTAAIALYDRAEFQVIGHRPNYYRHADGCAADAILMSKQLA